MAQAPANDNCIDAQLLEPDVTVNGDNTKANFDFVNQGICGPRSDRVGVWYKIVGKGVKTTVSVCTTNDKVVDFGVLNVCNSNDQTACVGFPSQTDTVFSCADDEFSTYEWVAEEEENYFVHVRADIDADKVGASFNVSYSEEGTDSPTDNTSAAMAISPYVALAVGSLVMAWF